MVLQSLDPGEFPQAVSGVDWGWWPDPWACNRVGYDAKNRVLYVLGEARCYQTPNRETAALVKAMIGG